jgi:hypothetical protein
MATFDGETLRRLRDIKEVAIWTEKHPKSRVVIWVVVAGDDVFVRSVRGPSGRWHRDLAAGGLATLEAGGGRIEVRAIPESDPAAIERASQEYLRKYQSSPYAPAMVKDEVLLTTLRLEPR